MNILRIWSDLTMQSKFGLTAVAAIIVLMVILTLT